MDKIIHTRKTIPIPIEAQQEIYNSHKNSSSQTHYENDNESIFDSVFPNSGNTNRKPPNHYEEHFDWIIDKLPENSTKKLKVISIQIVLGDSESTAAPRSIAKHIDCQVEYARDFEYDHETQTVIEKESLDPQTKEQVRERDCYECQRCGSETDLEVHHIIPVYRDGRNELDNLITLCHSCHWEAHGDRWSDIGYSSKSEFNDWLQKR